MSASRQCRGAVLLLVLGAVILLSLIAIEVARRAGTDAAYAGREERDGRSRMAQQSGVEIARAILAAGRSSNGWDFLGDKWNRSVQAPIDNNSGQVRVQLRDETGKLNIAKALGNPDSAQKLHKSLSRIFSCLRRQEPDRALEWSQVERMVNKRLGIEPEAAVPPVMTLDNLREAGVPCDMVYRLSASDSDKLVLDDVLTTFGSGKININTAPKAVLSSLDEEFDDALVDRIVLFRNTGSEKKSSDYKAFQTTSDLESVDGIVVKTTVNGHEEIVRNLMAKVSTAIVTQSDCFSARIETVVDQKTQISFAFMSVEKSQINKESGIAIMGFEEIAP